MGDHLQSELRVSSSNIKYRINGEQLKTVLNKNKLNFNNLIAPYLR